jgi:hypothetical protein
MKSNAETERAATQYVDEAVKRLLYDHRALGTAVTPGRVAAQTLTRIGREDHALIKCLAYRHLQQIARSRLNVEFRVLLQAQALATVRRTPPIIAGRTVMQQAA